MKLKLLFILFVFASSAVAAKDCVVKAVGNGTTLNTTVIQKTIDDVSSHGGGTIVFPQGKYLTGAILLKPNVTLRLERGAVMMGSTNPYDYYTLPVEGGFAHDDNAPMALIMAKDASNIALVGEGTIDGQGLQLALNIDSLHHRGIKVDPDYNVRRHRPSGNVRPKLFSFFGCRNITVEGLFLTNSACWGLSFNLCRNIDIQHVRILNRAYWNNDGIDISDCNHVKIMHNDINSADDGICLKSHDASSYCDSITIEDCQVVSSSCAVKFGTASYGGFRHVKVNNIRVFDTYRSAVAIECVDGGTIDEVEVQNVDARNTGNAFLIRLGRRAGDRAGTLRNVTIRNLTADLSFGRPDLYYDLSGPDVDFFHNPFPSSIAGLPGLYIENVLIQNVEIVCPGRASKAMAYLPTWRLQDVPEEPTKYPEYNMFGELPSYGVYVRHARNVTFDNVHLLLKDADFRPAYVLDDAQGVTFRHITQHASVVARNSRVDDTGGIGVRYEK